MEEFPNSHKQDDAYEVERERYTGNLDDDRDGHLRDYHHGKRESGSISLVTADTRERKIGSESWLWKGKRTEGERAKERKLDMENTSMRGRGRREEGGIGRGKAEDQARRIGIDIVIGPSGDLMTLTTMFMLTIDVIVAMRLAFRETGQLIS